MEAVLNICAANKLEELPTLINATEEFLDSSGMPPSLAYRSSLVIDELFNNVVSYAYTDQENHEIRLEIFVREKEIELIFTDDGLPFNPLDKAPPDLSLDVDERPIGGLGLHLVRSMAKNMQYERLNGYNVLKVVLESESD